MSLYDSKEFKEFDDQGHLIVELNGEPVIALYMGDDGYMLGEEYHVDKHLQKCSCGYNYGCEHSTAIALASHARNLRREGARREP